MKEHFLQQAGPSSAKKTGWHFTPTQQQNMGCLRTRRMDHESKFPKETNNSHVKNRMEAQEQPLSGKTPFGHNILILESNKMMETIQSYKSSKLL